MFDIEEFTNHIKLCKEVTHSSGERGYVRYTENETFKHGYKNSPDEYKESQADVLVHVFPNGHYVLMRNRIGADLSSLNLDEPDAPTGNKHQLNTPSEIAQIREAHAQGKIVEWWCVDEWRIERPGSISDWAFANFKFRIKPEQDENDPHAEVRRAFKAGAKVEFYSTLYNEWVPCPFPGWDKDDQYRIAEEPLTEFDQIKFMELVKIAKSIANFANEIHYVRFSPKEDELYQYGHDKYGVERDYFNEGLVYIFPKGQIKIVNDSSRINLHGVLEAAGEKVVGQGEKFEWGEIHIDLAKEGAEQTCPIIMDTDQIKEAVEQKTIYPTPTPILWWQKQADEQRAIKEDIIDSRNWLRKFHGMGS